ncbi:hypothetical protein QNI19_30185 [Cytophagaceae bacterium DM2B3-1]|uniref:Uncharacterized protein n=1 Tax=Xanthocytophaga flava TaxID=3048013 RepID=A0ABT7CUA0_9BACT|nr:hypothetical protein [Xanthocytophaga flavus]MDJ1472530.1 hypothetical protein [Xanthocytophaga flavus]MDJ1497246.1 hypothetical protein [Xanthocytophaga flavus]
MEDSLGISEKAELEKGYCCECGETVAEFITDGFIFVSLVKKGSQLEYIQS